MAPSCFVNGFTIRPTTSQDDDLEKIGKLLDLTDEEMELFVKVSKPCFPSGTERHVIFGCFEDGTAPLGGGGDADGGESNSLTVGQSAMSLSPPSPPPSSSSSTSQLLGIIEVDCRQHLVDTVVPGSLLQLTDDPCFQRWGYPRIRNLYVHKDSRRMGIGRELVEHATQYIVDNHWECSLMTWQPYLSSEEKDDRGDDPKEQVVSSEAMAGIVLANNTGALKFFEGLGFRGTKNDVNASTIQITRGFPRSLDRGDYKNPKIIEMIRQYETSERCSALAETQKLMLSLYGRILLREIVFAIKQTLRATTDRWKLRFYHGGGRSSKTWPLILKSQEELDSFKKTNPRCLVGFTARDKFGEVSHYPWLEACRRLHESDPGLAIAEIDISDPQTKLDSHHQHGYGMFVKFFDHIDSDKEKQRRGAMETHFDRDYRAADEIVSYTVKEILYSDMKVNFTSGLAIWATRQEALTAFGRRPFVADVGAIHVQLNSTFWPKLETIVYDLAKRQHHDSIGVIVEKVPDNCLSSILQYVRNRSISIYVYPLSGQTDEDKNLITNVYDEIPALKQEWDVKNERRHNNMLCTNM